MIFLQYPEAIRRIIYTTNSIESLNNQLRKVTKNKRVFPSDSSFDKKYQKHAIILKQTKSIKTENGKIYKRNTEKFFPIIMMPV